MKKLLIITLMFWGCDFAPTEHTHEHEHDTTHEHNDIYGCTDSTATNFDSTATIFDNSCEYSNEIFDVDWILLKNPNMYAEYSVYPHDPIGIGSMESSVVNIDTGYTFLYLDSSYLNIIQTPIPYRENNITSGGAGGMPLGNAIYNYGIIKELIFTYNGQEYNYDVSDSETTFEWQNASENLGNAPSTNYAHTMNLFWNANCTRISINLEEGYIIIFDESGEGDLLSIISPIEIIDYR